MDKATFSAEAHTKSTSIQYTAELCLIAPKDCQRFIDRETFRELCATGCANYNRKWSCPPYSPSFYNFASGFEMLYLLYMRADLAQFSYIKNDYLKIKAANSILKSRSDKFLRRMAKQYGRYITTGSCRLCKPCKFKMNMPCAHPEEMSYSFEAMGINVGALVEICSERPLLWYKPGLLPEYTSIVSGLLTNKSPSIRSLISEYYNMNI